MGKRKNLLWWAQGLRLAVSSGFWVLIQRWTVSRISAVSTTIRHHQNYVNFQLKVFQSWMRWNSLILFLI
jgi:hypothetical protein